MSYMPKQMNGAIISSYERALKDEILKTDSLLEYLHGVSIETAHEKELEQIGKLIGYSRPLVPEGFNQENIMLLGSLPLQTDIQIGLSQVGSETGGILSTTTISQTQYMDIGMYRRLLPKVAIIKRYGITLHSVDLICSAFGSPYTIDFDEKSDIMVIFKKNIGFKNVWILTQLFYRVSTAPQIIVYSGI